MLHANSMKTLTEFPGMNLKLAAKAKQDLLASGKTAEELPQAMGEALKIEGDRLNFLLNALELVGTKLEDLKRTVVYSLAEGEKAPARTTQKGDHYYLVEYFPSLTKNEPSKNRGPQDGDKPKGRGAKGRKGKRGGGGKGDFRRGNRDEMQAGENTAPTEGGEGQGDRPQRHRRPRFPRRDAQPNPNAPKPNPTLGIILSVAEVKPKPEAPSEKSSS